MDYELSTMQSEQLSWIGIHEKDEPRLIPGKSESRVRIQRPAVFGIFCCLFLILVGVGVTLYFCFQLYTDKSNELTRRMHESEWQSQTALRRSSSDDIDLSETNCTQTKTMNVVQMAQKMDELTMAIKALNDKVDNIVERSVDNEESASNHREETRQKMDVLTRKVGSVYTIIDIMEKKQGKIEGQVKTIQTFINHTENALETITGTISSSIEMMESRMESVNKQMNVTNGYIADVNSAVNGEILKRFNKVEEYIILNKKIAQNSTKTLSEISNRTKEILTQMQRGINITQKVDSGLKTLDEMSRTAVSELNVTIQGNVLDLEELGRSLQSNEMLANRKLDTLTQMSNKTQEMLKVIGLDIDTLTSLTPHTLSIQNISDQIALASSSIQTAEEMVREINNKTSEGLELQKEIQGSQKMFNTSLHGLHENIISIQDKAMIHTADILFNLRDAENETISAISNINVPLSEISNMTMDVWTQVQLGRNITPKIYSGLKRLGGIEIKLNNLHAIFNQSRKAVSDLNRNIQGNILNSIEELARSLHLNEMLINRNLYALTQLTNETQEMLEIIGLDIDTLTSLTPHKRLIQNISDQIALASSSIQTAEEVVREISSKTVEGLELQKDVQGSQKMFNTSLHELHEYVESINVDAVHHTAEILLKLHDAKNKTISAINNINVTFNNRRSTETGLQRVILSKMNVIETMTEFLNASLTIRSSAIPDHRISTAVVRLLAETREIKEAVMTPPATFSFIQKGSVRLANVQMETGSIRGRLEVYRRSSWGTVCDDSFSNTDARVACRMFGYSTGTQKQSAFFGAGTGTIHMDDVDCSGRENSIFSCSFTSNHNCGHGEDVGVICS